MLNGRKTYILAALYGLVSVYQALTGDGVDLATIQSVIEAGLVASFRHAITKS